MTRGGQAGLPLFPGEQASPDPSPRRERKRRRWRLMQGERPRAPEAALNRPSRSPTELDAADAGSYGVCAAAW